MVTKLLLVDDHEGFRAEVRTYLEASDYHLQMAEAASGEAAVAQARVFFPDIVLMDVCLPKMNGLMAAQRIKEQYPHCVVILLTLLKAEMIEAHCRKGVVSGMIQKDNMMERLLPVLADYIQARLCEGVR